MNTYGKVTVFATFYLSKSNNKFSHSLSVTFKVFRGQ